MLSLPCPITGLDLNLVVVMKPMSVFYTCTKNIYILTYSSSDAVDALSLYACAFHHWQFVQVDFWLFRWRPIL